MERGGDRGGFGGDRGVAPPARVLTPTNSVYIGNLLFDVTPADLTREFEQFGPIVNSTVAADSRGLSKGYCPYFQFSVAVFCFGIGIKLMVMIDSDTSNSKPSSKPPLPSKPNTNPSSKAAAWS